MEYMISGFGDQITLNSRARTLSSSSSGHLTAFTFIKTFMASLPMLKEPAVQ